MAAAVQCAGYFRWAFQQPGDFVVFAERKTTMIGELFDPKARLAISEHFRPHWSQAGAIVFITFRTADSIPRDVLQRWEREKNEWIIRNTELEPPWRTAMANLQPELQKRFKREFNRCREVFLDGCHGACVLRQPKLAKIVSDSLMHFDGDRYRMGDFIVMPNHVHLLASFASEDSLVTQCDSWLHFTARQINLELNQKGKFWQQEPFDHLVRSPEQYDYLRNYIRENPVKAGLREGEYFYRRYEDRRLSLRESSEPEGGGWDGGGRDDTDRNFRGAKGDIKEDP